MRRGDDAAAVGEYAAILRTEGLHADYAAVARLALARALRRLNRPADAMTELAQVVESEGVAASHRATALQEILDLIHQTGLAPRATVLEHVLAMPRLAEDDATMVRRQLAAALLRGRQPAGRPVAICEATGGRPH